MIGLGIETSCDETSIAIVKDAKEILSNVVYSQIQEHQKFYGIVPEIASRSHLIKINEVYEDAINKAQITPKEIDYIAVTTRPGLIGSLMIGSQFAKTFSIIYKKPIVDINHIEAHFYANFLERKEKPEYPFLGLLISGGNTAIYLVEGLGKLKILGNTQDDALGEAFDKAASILQLGYPGGPIIEKKAKEYTDTKKNLFSKILQEIPEDQISFSYSGIKTSLLYYVQKNKENFNIPEICYNFQETCFELIIRMLKRAINSTQIKKVEAGGGVLANQRLRDLLEELAIKTQSKIYYPKNKILCTDNGAMIAALGYYYFLNDYTIPVDFSVHSTSDF